jgi:phosphate transport system protein
MVYQKALVNYLISMARTVEGTVNRSIEALLSRNTQVAGEIFLLEPRINEMEIVIDEHAVRMLRAKDLPEEGIRMIVAALKVNNDLERMGDLAVNIAQRVVALAEMPQAATPADLPPMAGAVRAMMSKSLGALIFRNVDLANEVLESDDVVDGYRDVIFERLLAAMTQDPSLASPNMQFVLATRYLERIADHATNIAEDILFWLRGLDVRHGRGVKAAEPDALCPVRDSETGAPDLP